MLLDLYLPEYILGRIDHVSLQGNIGLSCLIVWLGLFSACCPSNILSVVVYAMTLGCIQSLRIGRHCIASLSLFHLLVVWLWYPLPRIQGLESYGLLPTRSRLLGPLWSSGIGWSGWRCGGLFRSQGWPSSSKDSCWLRVLSLLWYRSLPSSFQPPVRVNLGRSFQMYSPLFPSVSCLWVCQLPFAADHPLPAFCWLPPTGPCVDWIFFSPSLGIRIGSSLVCVRGFRRQGTSLMTLL